MKHSELIKKHLYKIELPDFRTKLYISFEQSYDDIEKLLLTIGIKPDEVYSYIEYGKKGKHIQGRTTLFIEDDVVLIKLNYFDSNIRSISILVHEIIHATKKILYMYESSKERLLSEKEEAECYLTEYIFEELMCIIQPQINYTKQYRNLDWLHEITHTLNED